MTETRDSLPWNEVGFLTRTCPHCGIAYYGIGHVLVLRTPDADYETCLSLLMPAIEKILPGVFTVTKKEPPPKLGAEAIAELRRDFPPRKEKG